MDTTSQVSTATVPAASLERIVRTPGVCGGRPRIAGHRIKVEDVAIWHERMGMSPDEIVSAYPTITLSDVYSALAYYHDHRDRIDADLREAEAFADAMRAGAPSIFDKARQRHGKDGSVPSG